MNEYNEKIYSEISDKRWRILLGRSASMVVLVGFVFVLEAKLGNDDYD